MSSNEAKHNMLRRLLEVDNSLNVGFCINLSCDKCPLGKEDKACIRNRIENLIDEAITRIEKDITEDAKSETETLLVLNGHKYKIKEVE